MPHSHTAASARPKASKSCSFFGARFVHRSAAQTRSQNFDTRLDAIRNKNASVAERGARIFSLVLLCTCLTPNQGRSSFCMKTMLSCLTPPILTIQVPHLKDNGRNGWRLAPIGFPCSVSKEGQQLHPSLGIMGFRQTQRFNLRFGLGTMS